MRILTQVKNCDVYKYIPDMDAAGMDADPLSTRDGLQPTRAVRAGFVLGVRSLLLLVQLSCAQDISAW